MFTVNGRQSYRKFDGVWYKKYTIHRTKAEAERDAKRVRSDGYRVRTIKVSEGYQLYATEVKM